MIRVIKPEFLQYLLHTKKKTLKTVVQHLLQIVSVVQYGVRQVTFM